MNYFVELVRNCYFLVELKTAEIWVSDTIIIIVIVFICILFRVKVNYQTSKFRKLCAIWLNRNKIKT